MAEPKIYSRNYINNESQFTMSHGSSFTNRLYDGDKDSLYQSSGANNDGTQVTIDVTFKSGAIAVTRTVDRIIILNHNFDDVDIDYWDGSAWQDWTSESSGVTHKNKIYSLSSQAITRFRIQVSGTQVADQEKSIGQLIACEEEADVGVEITEYRVANRDTSRELRLGDGALHRAVNKHSQNRSEKYEANVTFRYLTEAQLEALETIKENGRSIMWQPESTYRVDEIYHVNWVGGLQWRYSSKVKGSGYDLTARFKEV